MVSVNQVMDALKGVMDPEIRRSIVELGMVREVTVKGDNVKVTIALTVPTCPMRDAIAQDAARAVDALADNLYVEIVLDAMTPEEKQRLSEKLRRERAGGAPAPESVAAQMNRVKAVIAIVSGKGGVGKSTAAALLAVGLRRQGLRVGVLDADITGPSIPKLFGVHEAPMMGPLGIVPPQSVGGVKIMSINLMLEAEDDAVIWRGPMIASAITQFWNDVFWGDLDALVVDLPPGTSDAALTVMQNLPVTGCIVVTSPQELADMVVRKAAKMAAHLNIPILGILENMSYAICPHCGEKFALFGAGRSAELAAAFGATFLGGLGIDPELTRLSDAGQIEAYDGAEFTALIETVLARLG